LEYSFFGIFLESPFRNRLDQFRDLIFWFHADIYTQNPKIFKPKTQNLNPKPKNIYIQSKTQKFFYPDCLGKNVWLTLTLPFAHPNLTLTLTFSLILALTSPKAYIYTNPNHLVLTVFLVCVF
jgi:hypothetical protein